VSPLDKVAKTVEPKLFSSNIDEAGTRVSESSDEREVFTQHVYLDVPPGNASPEKTQTDKFDKDVGFLLAFYCVSPVYSQISLQNVNCIF